jgi:hypothetical protein
MIVYTIGTCLKKQEAGVICHPATHAYHEGKECGMKLKKMLVATVAGALVFGALTASAFAAPSEQGQCRQAANDAFVAASDEETRGDFQSDEIFGNEPNMADGSQGGPSEQEPGSQAGNVLPSQSPGPFVNNPNDPDNPTFGFTGGDLQAQVKAACNS